MTQLPNGIQIFAGSVPIYRNGQLVGAIGVSGDGIDQDDMVAFLGPRQCGQRRSAIRSRNAPAALRADTIVPQGTGTRLRYVNCPQAPFNDSTEQNVCAGHLIAVAPWRGVRARRHDALRPGVRAGGAPGATGSEARGCRSARVPPQSKDGRYELQVLASKRRRPRRARSRSPR